MTVRLFSIQSMALIVFCFLCTPFINTGYAAPSFKFDGRSLRILIDGVETRKIPEFRFVDPKGVPGRKATWEAVSKDGKPCFQYSIVPPDSLGTFSGSDIILVEIRPDREQYRWRDFKVEPSTHDWKTKEQRFGPNQKFCPKEFFLTDRLRFERLPAGTYYLGINVNGTQSWDRQDIKLTVE